jgi:RimJ/RimL family protein N-acetyltransferase
MSLADATDLGHGDRLAVYTVAHDAATVRWLNDPAIRATFGLGRPIDAASHRRWVESATHVWLRAIETAAAGHVGNVLLHREPARRAAYFQIYLGEPYARGQGLGARVLDATLAHAFESEHVHRVWLHTLPDNVTAGRLYARAGFVLEGVERDALPRDGGFVSQYRWSLLAPDWRSRRRRADA